VKKHMYIDRETDKQRPTKTDPERGRIRDKHREGIDTHTDRWQRERNERNRDRDRKAGSWGANTDRRGLG